MKVERIVVTTDLSDESLHPCGPITEFAKSVNARVTLLHVMQDLSFPRQQGSQQ